MIEIVQSAELHDTPISLCQSRQIQPTSFNHPQLSTELGTESVQNQILCVRTAA
jgi:hypothetical protein